MSIRGLHKTWRVASGKIKYMVLSVMAALSSEQLIRWNCSSVQVHLLHDTVSGKGLVAPILLVF